MAGRKGSTFDTDLLALIFNATTITGIAQNAGSPLTVLYVALHTADPTAGGGQNTNEATYGSYARIPVNRDGTGFTVSGNSVVPVSTITFATAISGTEVETWFSVGTASTGAGKILYMGPISPSISVSTGTTPQLTVATTITES